MHPLLIELELEHRNLRKVLIYLRQQVDALGQGREDTVSNITLTLEYMHLQPEIAHHVNEEQIGKALLESGAQLSEQLQSIRRDHGTFAALAQQLINTIRKHPRSRRLPDDLAAFIERYEQHMVWEEKHLLPMAERVLDHRAWATIEDAWIAHPDPVFGADRQHRFMPLTLAVHSM